MTVATQPHFLCLISLETHSSKCFDVFKSYIKQLGQHVEVVEVSSIYRLEANTHWMREKAAGREHEDLYCVGLKLATQIPARLFNRLLIDIAKKSLSEDQLDPVIPTLLAYDDLIEMSPDLTLPHPELHLQAKFLIPALDIWPEYFHGVLESTLSHLSQGRQLRGQFFAQGKSLLDFPSSQA